MRDKLIVNDVHLGVERVAGTTPASQALLEAHLQLRFRGLIMEHLDKDLVIAGDLFDAFEVALRSVIACHSTLAEWLAASDGTLTLSPGNHDIGKRSDRPSSFALLAHVLQSQFGGRVKVVNAHALPLLCGSTPVYVEPHMMNQTEFDAELEFLCDPGLPAGFVILHANCMSPFAEHSDHSLNVDEDTLAKLSRRHRVLFAHEHQRRTFDLGYKPIIVMGNQWPSSIADCLSHGEAQKHGVKFAHVIRTDGEIELLPTWRRDGSFLQVEWDQLGANDLIGLDFIRVTGTVSAEQAADVIGTVARFRQQSMAFVVANAVKVGSIEGAEKMTELNVQSIKKFDVMKALLDQLDPDEQAEIKSLMEE